MKPAKLFMLVGIVFALSRIEHATDELYADPFYCQWIGAGPTCPRDEDVCYPGMDLLINSDTENIRSDSGKLYKALGFGDECETLVAGGKKSFCCLKDAPKNSTFPPYLCGWVGSAYMWKCPGVTYCPPGYKVLATAGAGTMAKNAREQGYPVEDDGETPLGFGTLCHSGGWKTYCCPENVPSHLSFKKLTLN